MTWTVERIAEVTKLWNLGLTTAEIGRLVGVSKNAIVGKAHRLGLPPRPSPIKREARTPRPTVRHEHRHVERTSPPAVHLVISTNGATCKWPSGHPGEPEFDFCGQPAVEGKPYCAEHYGRAYIQPKPKSNAA
ncbi:MAG: global cell cycle regulator GcrA-like protein [Alphaproteobacteria bacterium]|nr:global cell cycle regulator GcrA-like protein [Alphaproteobacteria bacterium]